MKSFKTAVFYSVFLMCFSPAAFSGPIDIALLENPMGIEESPFAPRVHVFAPSASEVEEEFQNHGAQVCSVLVGKNSPLPKDTTLTLIPSLKEFSSYLKSKDPEDLVILNWSGAHGHPQLPLEFVEELEGIQKHFSSIIEMQDPEFDRQVQDYIETYAGLLEQLPFDNTPLSDILTYAKTCLVTAKDDPKKREEMRATYSSTLAEKIRNFRKYGDEQFKSRFDEMKEDLHNALEEHSNTLIVWALGNDGVCIELADPFWKEMLLDDHILSHTLLVHGLDGLGRRHVGSNFTLEYAAHTLGKPYCAQAWNSEESRYIQEHGTSFSTPLVTIEAFIKAQEMREKTGEAPLYTDVKEALLKK